MLYQTLKFYLARITVSLFLVFVFGFSALYFLHEVALPNVLFDDLIFQGAIFLVCLFFGFVGYGMLGEQRFFNSLHKLKNISPQSVAENITSQFENLIDFSYSSYFLPATGKRYRNLSVLQYADYLLSIGDETPKALNVYVQAFIQSPKNSRFRKPLLSILNRGQELTQQEMDLLLIMFQQEEEHDPVLTSYLAALFLNARQWSGQTEPLFLSALEKKDELSEKIIRFVLPIYLSHSRTDERALGFYIKALNYSIQDEEQVRTLLAQSFCEGNLVGVAPDLHRKCEEIFYQLEPKRQAELKTKSDETRIAHKLKKVKLFRKEDLQDLKRLKMEMGLVSSKLSLILKGIIWLGGLALNAGKWIILRLIGSAERFGQLSLKTKLVSFAIVSIAIIIGLGIHEPEIENRGLGNADSENSVSLPPKVSSSTKEDRIYTVQIAAVISASQANKLVKRLKRKGVAGLYIVKSKRGSGGHWYKLRAGKFESKNLASEFASQLVAAKTIKNYFIISLPKQ